MTSEMQFINLPYRSIQYSFYNLKYHEGLMRNLIFRNTTLNEWMVTVCFAENDMEKIVSLMNFIKDNFSYITSLNYIIND
jgi:23S rRNA (uracil1939-C5)-methyltransferase